MTAPTPVRVPKLTMAATEATFIEWIAQDGQQVQEGDPLYTVATDKVDTEVASPASGILRHGVAEEEVDYPVGTVLAVIETAG